VHVTQDKVLQSVCMLAVMDGRTSGLRNNFPQVSNYQSAGVKEFYCIWNLCYSLKQDTAVQCHITQFLHTSHF
jgi:hypothetical protein